MSEQRRLKRRMAGVLKARLPDLKLERVRDPRKARGKRWALDVLLRTCVVGLACRCRNLVQTALGGGKPLSWDVGHGVRGRRPALDQKRAERDPGGDVVAADGFQHAGIVPQCDPTIRGTTEDAMERRHALDAQCSDRHPGA